MWVKTGEHVRGACLDKRQKKKQHFNLLDDCITSLSVLPFFHSCCSCATWEPCALVCGVMEALERRGLVTLSPGSAPGLPVPTAPSDCASSSARLPTFALGSLSLASTSVTWRTAVKEKA